MTSFAGWIRTALFALLAATAPLHLRAQVQAQFDFNLPAQSLSHSLRAVGGKAHITIAFDPADVAGRRAPPLKGSYSARNALEHLLRDSGLRVRGTAAGSFWVEAVPARHHQAD